MRAKVVTTITTELDLDSLTSEHSVDINDCDGLSEISRDVLGAVLIGGLHATRAAVREQFPRAARADDESEDGED